MSSVSTTTHSATALRDLRPLDWPEVAQIYEDGIATGVASFETAGRQTGPPSSALGIRAVAELDGRQSVHVASWAHGRGVGRALLEDAIERSEAAGIWTLQAGIFPENKPGLRLHLGCGFRLVGVWRDVLLLERRSEETG